MARVAGTVSRKAGAHKLVGLACLLAFACAVAASLMGGAVVQPRLAFAADYAITSQPASVVAAEGDTVTFAVEVSDSGARFQWQKSTDCGLGWSNVSSDDAKASSYAVEVGEKDATQYRCVVAFSNGTTATSKAAMTTAQNTASIDGKGEFVTLADAMEAASDGDVIVLLANAIENVTGTSANVTIDLAGFEIGRFVVSSGSSSASVQGGYVSSSQGTIRLFSSVTVGRNIVQVKGLLSGNVSVVNGTYGANVGNQANRVKDFAAEGSTCSSTPKTAIVSGASVKYYLVEAGHVHTLLKNAAKCGTDRYYWICSSCNKVFADAAGTVSATLSDYNHKLSFVEGTAATCTEPGSEDCWECSACGKLFSDSAGATETTAEDIVIPARGHMIDHQDATEPTCEGNGYLEHWFCERCQIFYLDEACTQETTLADVILPKLGHDWSAYVVTTEPTCVDTGVETSTCSRCGKTQERDVDALGHDMLAIEEQSSTCIEQGHNAYFQCQRCELYYRDETGLMPTTPEAELRPLTTHSLTKVEAREASCTEFGCIDHLECLNCGGFFLSKADGSRTQVDRSEVVTAEALGHNLSKVAAVPATCTEQGTIEYYVCSRCKHGYADETAEKSLTDSDVMVAALGHDLVKHDATESTYTTYGNREYYTCSRCDKVFKADKTTETTVAAETLALKVAPSNGDDDSYYDDDDDTGNGAGVVVGSTDGNDGGDDDGLGEEESDSAYPSVVVDDEEDSSLGLNAAEAGSVEEQASGGLNDFSVFMIVWGVILVVLAALIAAAAILLRKGNVALPFVGKQKYAATGAAAKASERRAAEAAGLTAPGAVAASPASGLSFSFAGTAK